MSGLDKAKLEVLAPAIGARFEGVDLSGDHLGDEESPCSFPQWRRISWPAPRLRELPVRLAQPCALAD